MQNQGQIVIYILATTLLLVIMIGFVIATLLLHRKQQIGFLKEVELLKLNYEKEIFQTQLEIQEQTLQHISLELHDNVGHFLSLAKLHLATLDIAQPEIAKGKLDASVSLVGSSLDEIRNLSANLKTENIKNNGLIGTVERHLIQIKKTENFEVELSVRGESRFLDEQKEIVLFRIFQEALNNIFKHSKATRIDINFNYLPGQLEMEIADNGIGFNFSQVLASGNGQSNGIQNIIKRSTLISGYHEINSEPGSGTSIKVIIPY